MQRRKAKAKATGRKLPLIENSKKESIKCIEQDKITKNEKPK